MLLTSVTITRAQTSQTIDDWTVDGAIPDYFRRMYEAIAKKSNAEETVDEWPMLPAIVRGFVGSGMRSSFYGFTRLFVKSSRMFVPGESQLGDNPIH